MMSRMFFLSAACAGEKKLEKPSTNIQRSASLQTPMRCVRVGAWDFIVLSVKTDGGRKMFHTFRPPRQQAFNSIPVRRTKLRPTFLAGIVAVHTHRRGKSRTRIFPHQAARA